MGVWLACSKKSDRVNWALQYDAARDENVFSKCAENGNTISICWMNGCEAASWSRCGDGRAPVLILECISHKCTSRNRVG